MAEYSDIAKSFIDRASGPSGASGTWRLEILQKRNRSGKDGRPLPGKELPVRVRRFLKGIPWAHVNDAIRYLISLAPYEGIIYNGVRLEGSYRPTLTQWRRDDQEQVGGNAQGSYTLIQDLVEVTGYDEDLSTVSTLSCSEREETTWVWDSPSVEELPYEDEQGVTWAIRQVQRNEDGTFDYAIGRHVAKTQLSAETVTECDEYSTTYTRVLDNVYGGLTSDSYFCDTREPVLVPKPCESAKGETIRVQKSQNPDCTFKFVIQRTVAHKAVQVTETSVSLRGSRRTTVTRNSEAKGSEEGLDVGESVRNELQPDRLYTVTKVERVDASGSDVGSGCQSTLFSHDHSTTVNQKNPPSGQHVPAPSGGSVHEVTARRTDEGSWDVTDHVTTELRVDGATRSVQVTLRGVTETVTDRNLPAGTGFPDDLKLGDRAQIEKTPGNLVTRTVTRAPTEAAGDVGTTCRSDVFSHEHSTVANVTVDDAPDPEAPPPLDGKTYERSVRKNDEGTVDVTEKVSEEIAVEESGTSVRMTPRGATETVTHRNLTDERVSELVPPDARELPVGESYQVERTPGGRNNVTATRKLARKTSPSEVSSGSRVTVFSDVSRKVDSYDDDPGPGMRKGDYTCGGGRTVSRTATLNDSGTWDVETTETDPKARSWTSPDVDTNFLFKRRYDFRNFSKGKLDALVESVNSFVDAKMRKWAAEMRLPSSHEVGVSSSLNDEGLFDGYAAVEVRWNIGSSGQYGEIKTSSGKRGYITSFFTWKTFEIKGTAYNDPGQAPVVETFHPTNYFFVFERTHVRATGYGKELLDDMLKSGQAYASANDLVYPSVTFDYDENTERWSFDAVVSVTEPTTGDQHGRTKTPAKLITTYGRSYGTNAAGFKSKFIDPFVVSQGERIPGDSVPKEPKPASPWPDECGKEPT